MWAEPEITCLRTNKGAFRLETTCHSLERDLGSFKQDPQSGSEALGARELLSLCVLFRPPLVIVFCVHVYILHSLSSCVCVLGSASYCSHFALGSPSCGNHFVVAPLCQNTETYQKRGGCLKRFK